MPRLISREPEVGGLFSSEGRPPGLAARRGAGESWRVTWAQCWLIANFVAFFSAWEKAKIIQVGARKVRPLSPCSIGQGVFGTPPLSISAPIKIQRYQTAKYTTSSRSSVLDKKVKNEDHVTLCRVYPPPSPPWNSLCAPRSWQLGICTSALGNGALPTLLSQESFEKNGPSGVRPSVESTVYSS